MLDVFYLFLYVMFPILIVFLMNKYGFSFFKVSIPSFVILAMFAVSYVGTLPLYFGWDEYRYVSGVQDKSIVFQVFLFSCWAILSLVLGFIVSKRFLGSDSGVVISLPLQPLKKLEKILLCLLFSFCVIVIFVYLMKIQEVALWTALTQGGSAAALARSKMGNDFSGKYHWYSLMMHNVLNVLTFIFFANWLTVKNRLSFQLFLCSFLCATFTSLMAIEKSPFICFITGLFLIYLLIQKRGEIPVLLCIKFLIFLIIPLIAFYIFFMRSPGIIPAVSSVFSRVFSGQLQPAYHYLEFFPKHHDFLWGKSFPNPGGILPFKPYKLAVELMNWRSSNLGNSGVVGSMPTVFWGELYANFGTLGVLILPFFVGMGIYSVTFLIKKIENTPLKVGLYVWLILHYSELSISGISKFVLDFYLVGVSFCLLSVILISKYYTTVINKKNSTYS